MAFAYKTAGVTHCKMFRQLIQRFSAPGTNRCQDRACILRTALALQRREHGFYLAAHQCRRPKRPLWQFFRGMPMKFKQASCKPIHLQVAQFVVCQQAGKHFVLVEALAKTIDPSSVGGDVWRFFARYSVQGDLGGADVSGGTKTVSKGVYRNFAAVTADEPELFFRRSVRLWGQYHDTGAMQILGGRAKTNSVVVRLVRFNIPVDGFVDLQGYYLEEFGRLIGLPIESQVTHSTARGEPFCQWEYRLGRSPASEAYISTLPTLLDSLT